MRLKDKVAIVTGGAMGNGLGIVKVFLEEGAKVAILDYSSKLQDTLDELANQHVCGYQVDIRNKEKIKTIMERINKRFGKIDIIVNNAGVFKLEPFEDMNDELRDYHFDINIKGTWTVTKEALPYMQSGSIINLSSVTGPLVADSGEVAYATSKAAILGFTKALAIELVSKNIRVNAILPGYILTPMVETSAKESHSDPEKIIKDIAENIPMKRLGTPEEIGKLAAFLASDDSSYITGQGIIIDGGSTLPETMSMGI